jgi:NIMA-interacting peptidyl-prolyl cis-trans isomerase 4
MAPKGKDSGKGKGKGKEDDGSSAGGSGKLKAAQSINVRHILVGKPSLHSDIKRQVFAGNSTSSDVNMI